MAGCCDNKEIAEDLGDRYRRTLYLVIVLNAGMFCAEALMGLASGSTALWADALDFAADAATYSLTLWAMGQAPLIRARAARIKSGSLVVMAVVVLAMAVWRAFTGGTPEPVGMSLTAVAAFLVNLVSVLLLIGFREGDANIRSVWLCSRNDMIGNIMVLIAAAGVFGTSQAWPDLLVASVMAVLFLSSALSIFRQANTESATC